MRRWLGRLAVGVLVALAAPGCDYVAGICDCDCSCHSSCCYGLGGYHGVMADNPITDWPAPAGPEVHTAPAPTPLPTSPKLKGTN